jgi:hypothetical protein
MGDEHGRASGRLWNVDSGAALKTIGRMRLVLSGGVCVVVSLAGCLTIEQMAPPVGPAFVQVGATRGVPMSVLEKGREVYLSDCTRCHSVEPINRYSEDRWVAIIDRMGEVTKLDESRTDALRAYVSAARVVLDDASESAAFRGP